MIDMNEVLKAFANGTYEFKEDEINDKEHFVSAVWDDALEKWDYYITDANDSPSNYAFIDIEALDRLRSICEVMRAM